MLPLWLGISIPSCFISVFPRVMNHHRPTSSSKDTDRDQKKDLKRKAAEQSASEWNTLLIWARRERGPFYDPMTHIYHVDRNSDRYFAGYTEQDREEAMHATSGGEDDGPQLPPQGTPSSTVAAVPKVVVSSPVSSSVVDPQVSTSSEQGTGPSSAASTPVHAAVQTIKPALGQARPRGRPRCVINRFSSVFG